MAFDRYLAIVHPVRSIGWRTVRNSAIAIATTWVIKRKIPLRCLARWQVAVQLATSTGPVCDQENVVEFGFNHTSCMFSYFYRSTHMHSHWGRLP